MFEMSYGRYTFLGHMICNQINVWNENSSALSTTFHLVAQRMKPQNYDIFILKEKRNKENEFADMKFIVIWEDGSWNQRMNNKWAIWPFW